MSKSPTKTALHDLGDLCMTPLSANGAGLSQGSYFDEL